MLNFFTEIFSFPFMVRALVVGVLVSVCAALLGVSLVLKRYSMIGDGLSHVGFGALAIASAVNAAPLAVAIPVVVVAAFLLLRISENGKIKGDAAIALISTSAMAIGVVVVSQASGTNTDINNYLFGSILSLKDGDVVLSAALSAVVLTLFALFYNQLFAVTFDESFARATGLRAGAYNALLALLTALTIVLGMRMMGALLISSLVIFPSLTAMRLCKRFLTVTIGAGVIAVSCFFTGLTVSFAAETPTGATVVLVNGALFLVFSLISLLKRRLGKTSEHFHKPSV
ncbi:MAG: metal ABC transporter permease [Oscillospiraceae bacterium]|jgi:zinc transport system permease protein|nr:metal ABC transporter permease [Oscillospiraceae bacterium]